MKLKSLFLLVALTGYGIARAQTVDEIIAKYFENTGGLEKWKAVEGMKMTAKVNQGGMEIPLVIINLKDGRQMTVITFQGKEIKQSVFDGTTLWSHNFMNMKPEKSDAETTENFKINLGSDFPISLIGYKERGYKTELLGKETVDGTETFKVKLTKKPIKVDGQPKDNIEYYFFDAENFVPLVVESEITSGPYKGKIGQGKLSDYQDIGGGLLLPFSLGQGIKGEQSQPPLTITKVELNPKVDPKEFAFPEEKK
jgi:outer membrane lipoprotein-sorting protein